MRNHRVALFRRVLAAVCLLALPGLSASGAASAPTQVTYNYLPIVSRSSFVASLGLLDPSFDGDGIALAHFVSDIEYAVAAAWQPESETGDPPRLLVSVFANGGLSEDQHLLARFHLDGSLDASFGMAGWISTPFSAAGLVVQPDGNILAAGRTGVSGNFDFALARYLPDGSPDTSFGVDGLVSTDFGGGDDMARSLLVQPDGMIVAAGSAEMPTNGEDFALARYLPDGSLDSTFDGDGLATTDFGIDMDDFATALVLQGDGKLVLAGAAVVPGDPYNDVDAALARYLPGGGLDTSFDGDGLLTTDFNGSPNYAFDLLLQPDGKLLAAGWTNTSGGTTDFALARYTPEGGLDEGFGEQGRVVTDFFGESDFAWAAALQPDGRILLAGSANLSGYPDYEAAFAAARYRSDGSLDASFGTGGLVTTDIGAQADEGNAMLLQPDGKLILAGNASGDVALVRYR